MGKHTERAAVLLCVVATLSAASARAQPAARPDPKPPGRRVTLPGLVVDLQKRWVDVEATVCLDEGLLELIACTKGTKEHESIVAVAARPTHIHAALLSLGARSGNPAMRKPIDEQETRWIDVPPRGDPVDVFLVFRNREGKEVERPISDFVAPSGGMAEDGLDGGEGDADEDVAFPHTFLFAGSLFRRDGSGRRHYLADMSGHVITISTFGDELLCLPGIHAHQNGSLMWQVDAAGLPEVGTKVVLRLRPKARPLGTPRTDGREVDRKAP
jgi:hypothetical protein